MAKGLSPLLLGKRGVTLLRGRRDGLEVTFAGRDLGEAFEELEARLAGQPSFYRGAFAVANLGATVPSSEELSRLRDLLTGAGVTLRAISGFGESLESLARAEGLEFENAALPLSDSARSLVADFAGARNDIAQRRKRGEASVRRAKIEPAGRGAPAPLRLVEPVAGTLYHTTTLRGGQTLQQNGNIVVVGDVNPGAELIAAGDILVFGRLGGIAHAGAQGDENARILALNLAATQLRIATYIAADEEAKARPAPQPEAALVREGRIVILTVDRLNRLEQSGSCRRERA